jgi:hypothetical protein
MSNEEAVRTGAGRDRFVPALFAVVLVSAALYFARIVFEPIAFVLFAMALVWPFHYQAGLCENLSLAQQRWQREV